MNDLKSTLLILSASFSSTSCCFSSGITLKIVAFSLRLRICAVVNILVFIHENCHATFHHALITCCNVSRAGYIARDTFDFLVKATWPRISQWLSLFSWVKLFEYNNGLLLSSKAAKYQNFVFIKIHSHDRQHFIIVKQLQLAHYWLALRARQLFLFK